MVDEEILRRAVGVFGVKAQMQIAQEECGELIVAISHYMRGPGQDALQRVVEEVADVKIMMAQLEIIVGAEHVNAMIMQKMDRLRERMLVVGSW